MFKPMPHQSVAIPKMVAGDYMLVWDPGTGKTYPVIEAARQLGGPHISIIPAHLREQWAEQAERFWPEARIKILSETKKPVLDWDADFYIASYEYASVLPRWKELRRRRWRSMAIDEAHALMHGEATRTRAMLGNTPESETGLVFAADRVWPLTGTPFTFPNEIFPIMSRLFPGATKRDGRNAGYMTAREWENAFCVTAPVEDKRTGRSFGEKICGAKNIPELRERIGPYMSKVKLSDVHDRGEIIDTIVVEGDLRSLLKGLPKEMLDQYEALSRVLEDDEVPEGEKLKALETSGLVMAQLRHHIAVAKIMPTIEIVRHEAAKGIDKILIFGWHREPLKALAEKLKSPLIFGGQAKGAKAKAKDRFLNDPSCTYLLGQIGAIGTGTDGLQDVCHRAFFFEPSWAYRDNKQARHRTNRMGQRVDARTTFISLKRSVDEHVARVLARNAETISRVLD